MAISGKERLLVKKNAATKQHYNKVTAPIRKKYHQSEATSEPRPVVVIPQASDKGCCGSLRGLFSSLQGLFKRNTQITNQDTQRAAKYASPKRK